MEPMQQHDTFLANSCCWIRHHRKDYPCQNSTWSVGWLAGSVFSERSFCSFSNTKINCNHFARDHDSNCIFYKYCSTMTCNHRQTHLEQREKDRLMQGFAAEQIQKLAQAINSLNQNNFGNVDAYANATGLIPSTLVSVNSSSTNYWILDIGAWITSFPKCLF